MDTEKSRNLVNAYFERLFRERSLRADQVHDRYRLLWDRINKLSFYGGKRIRPYLTMVAYGQMDETITPVAAAQELVHIAMLIHDDVIDEDDVRRGQKNINGTYKEEYDNYLDPPRASHFASSTGILAGDALLSEAYFAIADCEFDAIIKQKILIRLHSSVYEVIGGELIDVEAGFVPVPIDPELIYRYKTSSYSFVGPLLTGAYCAELDEKTCVVLEEFGVALGIAYQIQDDLLGVFGSQEEIGKTPLIDLRDGKHTLLAAYHKEMMDEAAAERFAHFGKTQATGEQLQAIKNDMVASGAKQRTIDAASEYLSRALATLKSLEPGARRDTLRLLAEQLTGRKY